MSRLTFDDPYMPNLRRLMSEFGFESNDDYEYQMRCFLNAPGRNLRCLNIEGELQRRKTAFANALAGALEYPHVLYHDFSQSEPVLEPEPDEEQAPLSAFDRVVSEACAYSEAEPTILIIDQLQLADFRHHIRLNTFVRTSQWSYPLATLTANSRNFLLFVISEEPLYHSLQKVSFRLWADPGAVKVAYEPEEFGLDAAAAPVFNALADLFEALQVTPTPSEMQRVTDDLIGRAHTADFLRHSIYGWTEGVDHAALFSDKLEPLIDAVLVAAGAYLGVDEIEMVGDDGS
ncbi:MAG: hypothetical protein AAGB27_15490 [Pseudomonadota bacterium]